MLIQIYLRPQRNAGMTTVIQDMDVQGITGIKMQRFVGCDTMECGKITLCEQIIDTGAESPVSRVSSRQSRLQDLFRGAIYLDEVATLRMRLHFEMPHPVFYIVVDHRIYPPESFRVLDTFRNTSFSANDGPVGNNEYTREHV